MTHELPEETRERLRALFEDPRTVAFVHSLEELRARAVVISGDAPTMQLANRNIPVRVSSFVEPNCLVLAAVQDRFFIGDPLQVSGALAIGNAVAQSAAPRPASPELL